MLGIGAVATLALVIGAIWFGGGREAIRSQLPQIAALGLLMLLIAAITLVVGADPRYSAVVAFGTLIGSLLLYFRGARTSTAVGGLALVAAGISVLLLLALAVRL
jgi:hypothetical protein